MIGGRMFGGRSRSAPATFSRTSWAALSMSRSSTNWQLMRAVPACTCELTSSIPLMVESASSRGSTTWVVISSGVEPGSLMLMLTVAGSARGKRSTPRSRNEKMPRTPRNAISMTANTARLTHSSARVMGPRSLDRLYERPVAQLFPFEGDRYRRSLLQAGDDLDVGPLARPELDLGLVQRALLDRVDLVHPVEVAQRVLGHDQGLVHAARHDARPREEAGLEHAVTVLEEGFHVEGTGLRIHGRVHARHRALEGALGIGLHLHLDRLADRHPARHLLGHLQARAQPVRVHDD